MSWITVVWSMVIAACLTLAAIHLVIWSQRRSAWANLLFALIALSVAGLAAFEFLLMRAQTPREFAALGRWLHIPAFIALLAIIGFVRVYLSEGRLWLAWGVIASRVLVLAINFLSPTNINYREISALVPRTFLGETISVAQGVANPWSRFAEVSSLLVVAFVVDASISLWRRGDYEKRRRAAVIGGSMALFILVGLAHTLMVRFELIGAPQMVSFAFMFFLVAMAFELSRDLLRAAQLADDLRESEQGMALAAHAARLGLWTWDILRNEIWMTTEGLALFGWSKSDSVSFENFMTRLHPEDCEPTSQAIKRSLMQPGVYDAEYRLLLEDGTTRWISARGQVEFNKDQAVRMRGVSIDITARKQAEEARRKTEQEVQRHQQELAHVSRVSIMGELSASMAHELNQPLTAILTNAQAGQRFLAAEKPDLDEFHEILKDIAQDTTRAREVIRQLRALAKKSEPVFAKVDLADAIHEVMGFLRGDIVARNVGVRLELAPALPLINGDRIQLQQILINLLLNAFDAMDGQPVPDRLATISMTLDSPEVIRVTVRDSGPGIPQDKIETIFEPFYTTKREGMGMGLSVTRSIVASHRGRIWAENLQPRGAALHFTVPVAEQE